MSTVAFLASVVDPRVASAAAKAALGMEIQTGMVFRTLRVFSFTDMEPPYRKTRRSYGRGWTYSISFYSSNVGNFFRVEC